MRILNYDVDDYHLKTRGIGKISMKPISANINSRVMFVDENNNVPDIIEESDFTNNVWLPSVCKGVTMFIKRKNSKSLAPSNCNILQTAIFDRDGVTPIDEVCLLGTKKELSELRVLAGGDTVTSYENGILICCAWLLVPKTARYLIDGYVYSCASGKLLGKYDKKDSRKMESPTCFVLKH